MKHLSTSSLGLRMLILPITVFSLVGICFSSRSVAMASRVPRPATGLSVTKQQIADSVAADVPKAQIVDFVMAHDCYNDSVPGINFYITFNTQHMKGHKGSCIVYMYYDGDDPKPMKCKDLGRYTSSNGQVSVGVPFQPKYDRASYRSYKLFLPYSMLGRHRILDIPLLALARIYSSTDSMFIEEQSRIISFTYK